MVDARLEAVTTNNRDVKCNTVISNPSAFGGGGGGVVPRGIP